MHPRLALLAAVATFAAACGGGGGSSNDGTPSTAGAVTTLSVPSAQVGLTYGVTVYTPAGYATSTDAKAVIYALDHELQYEVIRNTVERLRLDAIVVSIGNLGAPRRFIDFDLPGADPYYRFLTLELAPLIESQYRVDRSRRTLMGYSLSGLMAVLALMNDNPTGRYFSGYVITDPSLQFHTEELYAREQRMFDATRRLPLAAHVCSTSATYPFADFHEKIGARGYQELRWQFRLYQTTHALVLGPCVDEGLRYVFGRP